MANTTNGKAYLNSFKSRASNVGKVKQINWLLGEKLCDGEEYFINELHLEIPSKNETLM